MALMMSNITDEDGQLLLASCPFYHNNPLCVNSCALFSPIMHEVEGVTVADYTCGYCSLGISEVALPQLLFAVTDDQEQKIRKRHGWGLRKEKA